MEKVKGETDRQNAAVDAGGGEAVACTRDPEVYLADDELESQPIEAVEDAEGVSCEEFYEVEIDEDEIYAYIVDEDDNEIGFILLDEDGVEQEYYYAEEEIDSSSGDAKIDEDEIYAYIVDEDDNEIGFILLDEDGVEQEYYYAEEEIDSSSGDAKPREDASGGDEYDLGITREGVAEATADMNAIYKDGVREGVAEATADMNAIYKDGVAIASELKGAFDDIAAGFDFLKKK